MHFNTNISIVSVFCHLTTKQYAPIAHSKINVNSHMYGRSVVTVMMIEGACFKR